MTRQRRRRRTKTLFIIISLAGIGVLSAGVLFVFVAIETPSVENFQSREVAESTKIYDQTGQVLLWEIHGEEKRTIVPFESISRNVKNATIAIEDSSFYSHRGFSPISLIRVTLFNVFRGKQIGSGGSTITQQLVKNTLLTPERTITRKIKEIVIAVKLEAAYSKDDILNLYLNQIPYGSNAYGIEAASQAYFGKPSDLVTLAEAAYLVALPNAPSYYSPYGNHRKELEERKEIVLTRMRDLEFITNDEYEHARKEKVVFLPQKRGGIRAPHFVMYVRDLLTEKYGEDVVERGGLKVITTLDSKLQEKAEEIASRAGSDIEQRFNATNIAFVAIDPKTGRILSMVGSRDYFNTEREGNFNVALAHRQPGSAFKPIVYAAAFKKGYTPETALFDLETNFAVFGDPYIPQNYDEKFRGPVTMREALAQSLNVPAVKTLYLAGVKNSIQTAEDLGISSLADPSRYGLTLVLGGGEVSLLELSSAYAVFANQGLRADTHSIIEVRDHVGNILEQEELKTRSVLESNIANTISGVLSDNVARTPAFGAQSPLYFQDRAVAVKTGTTNDYRDVWTVGYSPNIVVGAWAGNNNNTSMTKNVAGFIIAPVWRELMDAALVSLPNDPFPPPELSRAQKPILRGIWKGSHSYTVDRITGKLATEFTPLDQQEERVVPEVHSILYWVSKDAPDGSIPQNPSADAQFIGWEGPVRRWAATHNYIDGQLPDLGAIGRDTAHDPANWPVITIPNQITPFLSSELLVFHPSISGTYPVTEADVFVDGEFVKSIKKDFGIITISPDSLLLTDGPHTLTLRVYDSVRNKREASASFTIAAP